MKGVMKLHGGGHASEESQYRQVEFVGQGPLQIEQMKPPPDDAVQRALEDEQEQEEQGGRAESAPEDRKGQRQAQPRPGGQDIVNDEYVRTGETFARQSRWQPEGEVVNEMAVSRVHQRPVATDEGFINGVADHKVRVLGCDPRHSARQKPQEGKGEGTEVNGQLPPGQVKRGGRDCCAQQDGGGGYGRSGRNGKQGPDPSQQEKEGGERHIGHGAGCGKPPADG